MLNVHDRALDTGETGWRKRLAENSFFLTYVVSFYTTIPRLSAFPTKTLLLAIVSRTKLGVTIYIESGRLSLSYRKNAPSFSLAAFPDTKGWKLRMRPCKRWLNVWQVRD